MSGLAWRTSDTRRKSLRWKWRSRQSRELTHNVVMESQLVKLLYPFNIPWNCIKLSVYITTEMDDPVICCGERMEWKDFKKWKVNWKVYVCHWQSMEAWDWTLATVLPSQRSWAASTVVGSPWPSECKRTWPHLHWPGEVYTRKQHGECNIQCA